MTQNWTDNVFQGDHVGQTDLQNMENDFACLKSLFSGSSQPASMAACHPWFDTSKHVLKVRNDGDTAWYGLMHGDTSQKMWVYRNAAMNGWVVDSGVADKVLALKGGSVYTTGGATAGTWQQPSHTLTVSEIPSHNHPGSTSGNESTHKHYVEGVNAGEPANYSGYDWVTGPSQSDMLTQAGQPHNHSITVAAQGGGGAHNHGSSYRPAAGVGTLQYVNL